jgi:hypothetical protein
VIYFPVSFAAMKSITGATLNLRASKTGGSHCSGDSTSKTMYVRKQQKTWMEDSPTTEGTWSNRTNDYTTLQGATTTGQATKVFSSGLTEGTWYTVDVTEIVQSWFAGAANYGFLFVNSNETNEDDGLEFYSREKGTGFRPYLEIDYTDNTAPNAPTSLDPTGDEVVEVLTPILSGTFSDPNVGDAMSGYQIQVYEDDGTTLVWDTGTIAKVGTSFSKQYAGTTLIYGDFYKWKARTKDSSSAWGPYSSLQRFQVVDDTPPAAIDGLSATAGDASITLDWTASELDPGDFDHYVVYRREFGEDDWEALISLYDPDDPTFEDLTPEFGVEYEYKVTQFKNSLGGFDIESPDSDIVQVTVEGATDDAWTVIGADGEPDHTFDLPVIEGPISTPIQQEIFEPLGSNRKTVVRGRVLGSEGNLTMIWTSDERAVALAQIEYITENRGPHVLRSPFGDVWLVEFGGAGREDLPAGHVKISLAWTSVA